MAQTGQDRPRRRGLVAVLLVVATILGFFALTAVWVNRQLLNTDNWTSASTQMLESKAIRTQLSAFLVDQAYSRLDVQAQIRSALPPRAAPLAGPAAGGLRNLAEQGVDRLLQRPRPQALWEQANRRAHRRLIQVVEGKSGAVSTTGGKVTLDLGEMLQNTSQGIGVGQKAASKLPPGAAQITILRSNELKAAQDVVNLLRKLALVLPILSLGLFAVAVAVSGRRRQTLRSVGIAFLVIGVGALLARRAAGTQVVDALASTESIRPAAHDAWEIGTSQLQIAAQAMVGYGIVLVLAAWFAGPMGWAVAVRRAIAPYLKDARIAFGAAAVLLVIVIAWAPTPATRNPITLLIFAALLALGVEALRRQTAREYPDATLETAAARRAEWWARARTSMGSARDRMRRGAHESEQPTAVTAVTPAASTADARLDRLERLGKLHETGVLDDQEFQEEKRRLSAAETPPPEPA